MILFKRIDPVQWLFSQRTIEMHQSLLISRTLPNSQTFISILVWISNNYLLKYLYNKPSFANITINSWTICEVLLTYYKLITVIPFAIFPLCHVPPIKNLTFFFAVVMFPSRFLATDSHLLKDVWGFCFGIFSFSI